MYEMEFVLAAATNNNFYRKRLYDFKRFGLLNIPKDIKIRLMLLLEKGTFGPNLIKGWPCDVVIKEFNQGNHVYKLTRHYLGMMNSNNFQSNWHIMVDDDSVTNVGGLYEVLSSYDPAQPIYFSTVCEYDYEVGITTEMEILQELGAVQFLNGNWNHDWESHYISRAAMMQTLKNPFTKTYLEYRKDRDGYSDQFLAYAARIAGVELQEAGFSSPLSEIRKFSLFGGHLHHIHYVSHDYGNTKRFKKLIRQ